VRGSSVEIMSVKILTCLAFVVHAARRTSRKEVPEAAKEVSLAITEDEVNRSQSSVVAPAFVRLRVDARHGGNYIGVCTDQLWPSNSGPVSYSKVFAYNQNADRVFTNPGTITFGLLGEAKVGEIIRLQETSPTKRCYLSVASRSICSDGYQVTCHSPNSRYVFNKPATVDWEVVEGSFADGSRVRLRNVHHNCYLGACGRSDCGGSQYGVSCHPVNSVRVGDSPAYFRLKVEQPGPITGTWISVGSGHRVEGQVTFTVGLTSSTGSSVSSSLSSTISASITGTIGFSPFGSSVSVTAGISVTSELSAAYESSRSSSTTKAFEWKCPEDYATGKWWMWQWSILVPAFDGKRRTSGIVKTSKVICTKCVGDDQFCKGPVRPRCPMSHCSDASCQKCHDGWQR